LFATYLYGYKHLPSLIFYFDNIKTEGEVVKINNEEITVKFYNIILNKERTFNFTLSDSNKLKELKLNKILKVAYSKNDQNVIWVINNNKKPSLYPVIATILYSVLLLLIYLKMRNNFKR